MWHLLMELVLLLLAAFVLGALAQRLGQSAIIGYLVAGTLVGPLLFNADVVEQVAELGVSLLLFSIGLEFSFSRLRQLGATALVGGSLQVIVTLAVFAGLLALQTPPATAAALGAMAALSSTAVVLRVLVDRATIDSVYGRNALGILLLQDIAVVPLVLLVTVLTQGGDGAAIWMHIGRIIGGAVCLVISYYGLFYHVVPRVLMTKDMFANRELMILLAIIIALGAIWSAHALGLSPALGAFLAGMLLAESPFATQIRADIGSIRTLFVTLFFTSVGMLADPAWFIRHLHWVVAALVVVVVLKTGIVYGIARFLKNGPVQALATGLTLAQVGEFSFVLAAAAHHGGLLDADQFALVVSVTILSMFISPYMITYAERWAWLVFQRLRPTKAGQPPHSDDQTPEAGRILVIGFGPAGQAVARALLRHNIRPTVIELNPRTAAEVRRMKLPVHIGDARSDAVLEHAGGRRLCAAVIALPDPKTCREVIAKLKLLSPDLAVITRARYHRFVESLQKKGALVVVDEEITVGQNLAHALITHLRAPQQATLACGLIGETPLHAEEE